MKRHISNTRRQLADLGAMAHKTEADERAILKNAEAQLEAAQAAAARNRAGIESASEAGQRRYTDLIEEIGRLQLVISKAKKALQA